MLGQVGYRNGVENYARHLAGREEGTPLECLIDYFPDDWLLIVDESHVTCSQLQAMYNGDQARKKVLIEHGFRLPSAADNRPLKGEEFWDKAKQTVFVSATPGNWEMEVSGGEVAEQVIRPTGVLDPVVEVRVTTARWMICWGRSAIGRPRTNGCWSQRSPRNGGRPHRLPGGERGAVRYLHSGDPLDRAYRDHSRTCALGNTTCWWASTCFRRVWTCRR